MCPLRGLVRSEISPSTQMDGKVPSSIALTWPVSSLTETGLGGAELNACAFNQWVAWNVKSLLREQEMLRVSCSSCFGCGVLRLRGGSIIKSQAAER